MDHTPTYVRAAAASLAIALAAAACQSKPSTDPGIHPGEPSSTTVHDDPVQMQRSPLDASPNVRMAPAVGAPARKDGR